MMDIDYVLIGFGLALATVGYILGIIGIIQVEKLKNKVRKIQEKLLENNIDTTEVDL